ncbi:MAG: RNA polymerase subunit sigma-24 [Roseibacillus sp.]|nr:RNA polymerase subunit sigma-24 [Roseibacillus sp.]
MTDSSSDRDPDDALDVSLMAKVAQGDHEAFEELVTRHQYAVVGTVAKMLGNPSEAEDVAQQVFLRLWKSAPRYRATAKFTTYLFTITRNLVFNESRRKFRRSEQSLEEQEDDWHQQFPEEGHAHPDQQLLQSELQQAVDRAIADLPEKQRMAVVLRHYEHMPYDEIAEVLGLSVSAVKSQLFRARSSLRETLKHYLDQDSRDQEIG